MKQLMVVTLIATIALVASPTLARSKRLVLSTDSCTGSCLFPLCLVGRGVRRPVIELCSDAATAYVTVRIPANIVPQGRSVVPRGLGPAFSVLGARVLLVCQQPDGCNS